MFDLQTKPFGQDHDSPPDRPAREFAKSAACPYCLGTKSVQVADASGTRQIACPTCSGGPSPLVTK